MVTTTMVMTTMTITFVAGHLQMFWTENTDFKLYDCPTKNQEYLLFASSGEVILTSVKIVAGGSLHGNICGLEHVTIGPRDNSSVPYSMTTCDSEQDNPILLFSVSTVYVRFVKDGDEMVSFGFRLTFSYHQVNPNRCMA